MQLLTLAEFLSLAKNAKKIAVFQEIPANQLTPTAVYTLLKETYSTDGVMLEDLHQGNLRYSHICFEPIASLSINQGHHDNPLGALRHLQAQHQSTTDISVAHLITNAVGFITYDVVRYFEQIPDRHEPELSLPICLFNFYALSLAFNHDKHTILISRVVETGANPEQAYYQTKNRITELITRINKYHDTNFCQNKISTTRQFIETDTYDADFTNMVKKAKEYITRGDAFQIVLSRCFKSNYSVSPFEIYQSLRKVSPAPFMFYIPTESCVIMGASPERLINVANNEVTVNPIAGTRKRTIEKTDEMIAKELLHDKKELAEHMMLLDLARNDVGAVSDPGSVHVTHFLQVKHYSHVSHITSTVSGHLQKKYDAFDALEAAFPAGTLSGAPKIRAMQIIDELETSRRGLYGGAICRIDSLGNLDSCIAIRTAILKNGVATIRAGAGIVFDSDPLTEAQETYEKARSLLDAIAKAHGE